MAEIKYNEKFEIATNERVLLEGGLKIQFLYHSHKRTKNGGSNSPLIVQMKYSLNGEQSEQQYNLNVSNQRSAEWAWNNYNFQLVDFVYNKSMQLIVSKANP